LLIRRYGTLASAVHCAFDLLELDGKDLRLAVRRGGSNGDEKESQAKAQENIPHQGAQAQKDDR
jgi:hypothetical protein